MISNTSPQHQAIKDRMNIIEVASHFLQLKKEGNNYVSKCPFHDEHTASFKVHAQKGFYKCFGCGATGDAIKFVMAIKQLSYLHAMQWLGDFYHLPHGNTERNYHSSPAPAPVGKPSKAIPVSYIPRGTFETSKGNYRSNHFVAFLHTLFDGFVVNTLMGRYHLGTSDYYPGGVIFWQVDTDGNVRTGKIMPYDPATGKRVRNPIHPVTGKPMPASNWVHALQKTEPYNLGQCLYGAHLLPLYKDMPVAVVESEKTAIVASVYFPEYIWLATGAKAYTRYTSNGEIAPVPQMLREKFKILADREVELFPDLGAVEDWTEMAAQLSDITTCRINDLLTNAGLPDKADLCDFLTGEPAREQLIANFAAEIAYRGAERNHEIYEVINEYAAKGLRREDRIKGFNLLLTHHSYEAADDRELHPCYYDASIPVPGVKEYDDMQLPYTDDGKRRISNLFLSPAVE